MRKRRLGDKQVPKCEKTKILSELRMVNAEMNKLCYDTTHVIWHPDEYEIQMEALRGRKKELEQRLSKCA